MFATERHKKTKQVLYEYKTVTVSGLSELLGVSEVTVRKDLERLEQEGFLIRTHGGAILNEEYKVDQVIEPNVYNYEEKKRIGSYAAEMINNNEAIYIGTGTTCLEIAKNLSNKSNITVITNNVSASIIMLTNPALKVILTGGYLKEDDDTYSLVGLKVIESIKDIYVDKAFIGVGGVDLKRGFTVIDVEEAMISKEIMKCTNELIVVADSSKFGTIDFSPIGNLKLAHKIISDEHTPEDYMKYCYDNNIQLYTTYNIDI